MRKRAGVVIMNPISEEILLIGRKKQNMEMYYVIPGGGVEANETVIEAARREITEELDIKAGDLYFLFENENETYFYSLVEEKKEYEIQGEEAIRQNENNLYIPTWVKVDELKNLKVYPEKLQDYIGKVTENKTKLL